MSISFSIMTLIAALTLSSFLGVLHLSLWFAQRTDRTPLWVAAWLGASTVFSLCRLLQYLPLAEHLYIIVPRILLTFGYSLAWLGYELGNAFIEYRPPRRERALVVFLIALPVIFLWASNLILTDQTIIRAVAFGGEFTGVQTGPLYLPASFLILGLGAIPVVRLIRAPNLYKRENLLMAAGLLFVILFSLIDFLAVFLNLSWFRFSDYSYLPVAIFYSYIQVQRFGLLYRDMDVKVHERTVELRQLNEALRTSEEHYRAVVESARDGIAIIQNGRTVYVNPQLAQMRGEKIEKIIGRHFGVFVHPDERHKVFERYRQRLAGEKAPTIYETILLRQDGSDVAVELAAGLVTYEGNLAEIIIVRDITERKEAEEALRTSEERYREIYENSTIGMYRTRPDGKILLSNFALLRMLGYDSFEELAQRNLEQEGFIRDYSRSEFRQRIESEGKIQGYESAWIRKDGSTIFVSESARAVRDTSGNLLYYEGTIENITERKQAEEIRNQTVTRRQRELDVVTAIAASASLADGVIQELAVELTEAASNALGIERVNVWLFEEDETQLVNIDNYVASIGEHSSGVVLLEREFQNEFATLKNAKYVDAHDPLTDPRTTGYIDSYLKPNRITSMLDAVIRSAGRNLGVLCFEHVDKQHHWEDDEITFVCQLADQVALTISNHERKQAEDELRRRANEMTALYETARDLAGEGNVTALLNTLVERAATLFDNVVCGIYLYDTEQGDLRLAAVTGDDMPIGTRVSMGEGMAGKVAQTRQPLIIKDYRTWDERISQYGDIPFTSVLQVPMLYSGELIGILSINDLAPRIREFTEADTRLLSLFAATAAGAVHSAWLLEAQIRRSDELGMLYRVGQSLTTAPLDSEEIAATIARQFIEVIGFPECSISILDPENETLQILIDLHKNGDIREETEWINKKHFIADFPATAHVVTTFEPLVVYSDDPQADAAELAYMQEVGTATLVILPLVVKGKTIGIIELESQEEKHPLTKEGLNLAKTLANQAAIAIENSRLFTTEQKRRKEADAIAEIDRDISSTLQLDLVLERIALHAKNLLDAETSAVYLARPETQFLQPVAAIGMDADEIMADFPRIGEGILGNIALQKTGEIVNNIGEDPRAVTISGTEDILIEHLMGVPVLSENRLTGLIAVWRVGEGLEFKLSELGFLSNLAGQVAIAIQNASLFESEQRRRREADTLRQAAEKITSTLDQEQAIHLILEQLVKVVSFESASIQLLRDGYLEIVGGRGWPDPSIVLGLRFPIPGENPNSIVVFERRPVLLGNASDEYPNFNDPPHIQIESWLGVPLIVRDRVIGMFAVDHSQPDFFTDADVQMVNAFAGQAAIAIENARLFQETQKRLREMEGLVQVSATLSSTLKLESLLENILQSAIHAIPVAERGSILLADEEEKLHIRAVWGYADPRIRAYAFPPESGYSTVSFRERRAILVPDVRAESRIRYNGDIPEMLAGGSAIAVPLVAKDRAIGVIAVDTTASEDAFTEGDLRLLETMASPAALAIENARLFESTHRRLSEIEAVHTVSTALRSAQSLDEALPIILDQLIELLNAGSALIDVLDLSTGEIVTELARGAWAQMTGLRTPEEAGGSGRVISTGQPYISNDLLADKLVAHPDLLGGLNTAACVPVIAQHQPIGALWVGRQTPIRKEEVSLLAAVGEMVGNAIQRMKLNEQTERRADEFETLYRTAHGLALQWNLDTLLETVVTQAMGLLQSPGGGIYIYNSERNDLQVLVAKGPSMILGLCLQVGEGMAGRVLQDQQPMIVDDYQTWEGRSPKYEGVSIRALVEVPITFAGEFIGVLAVHEIGESKRKYVEAEARLLSLLATQAASAIRTARLLDDLQTANIELAQAYDTTLEGWAKALEIRDKETEGHSRRVTDLTLNLARYLDIDEPDLTHIRRGVLLHDIGKMGVPDHILKKTGPLGKQEWVEMRKHPKFAHDLLNPITYLRPALDIPYCHHEKWDGTGYPRGLKGDQIPLAARIFAVVDVYDALSSNRPYRAAWPEKKVLSYLREQSGRHFDPQVVDAFLEINNNKGTRSGEGES